jgi:threonine synthase
MLPTGVWRYRRFLPEVNAEYVVSLGEGGTPLLRADRLGDALGLKDLRIKDETRNPTGSFLDRGATVLISIAKRNRVDRIECTTTGNFGASIAAYSAKAGIQAEIKIHPKCDSGKLYQMIAYGAKVEILSNSRSILRTAKEGVRVAPSNPYLLAGEKTTAFEIVQELGWDVPDYIVLPVGTGGHLTMVWEGIKQLSRAGLIKARTCKLVGVHVSYHEGTVKSEEFLPELEESEPAFRKSAKRGIEESGGFTVEVSAVDSMKAMGELARVEGVFAEPAAASVIAALEKVKERELVDSDSSLVCIITGSGLKDTKGIARIARTPKHIVVREEMIIRPVEIGRTKLKILRSLNAQPLFGYGLWKDLRRDEAITVPSVYQHLSELEGAGFVRRLSLVVVRGRDRIFYELTGKGREALKVAGGKREVGTFVVD